MRCAFYHGVNNWQGESAMASENSYQVVAGILRYRLVQVADFDRPAIGSWRGLMVLKVKTPQYWLVILASTRCLFSDFNCIWLFHLVSESEKIPLDMTVLFRQSAIGYWISAGELYEQCIMEDNCFSLVLVSSQPWWLYISAHIPYQIHVAAVFDQEIN